MKKGGITIITLFFLWLCGSEGKCGEKTFPESGDVTISLVESLDVPGMIGKDYIFEVFQHSTQSREQLIVHADTNELTELKVYKHNLILIGSLSHGGDSITCINWQTRHVNKQFWAYFPKFSPDNRFVVYIAHYPRHLPRNAKPTDIVKIYDFGTTWGGAVFPEEDMEAQNDQPIVYNNERPVYSAGSHFLWLAQGRKIVFIAHDKSLGEYANFLVLVDLDNSIQNPRIIRRPIDSSLSHAFRNGITEPMVVKELAEDNGTIIMKTYRNYGLLPRRTISQKEKTPGQTIRISQSVFQ